MIAKLPHKYGNKCLTNIQPRTKQPSKYVVCSLAISNAALQRFCFLLSPDKQIQRNGSLRFWEKYQNNSKVSASQNIQHTPGKGSGFRAFTGFQEDGFTCYIACAAAAGHSITAYARLVVHLDQNTKQKLNKLSAKQKEEILDRDFFLF